MSDLKTDPIEEVSRREATSEDVLTFQTALMCEYPSGPSTLQERAFLSQALDKEGIDPDSYDLKSSDILLTGDFMDSLAAQMNLQCPAQLARLLEQ